MTITVSNDNDQECFKEVSEQVFFNKILSILCTSGTNVSSTFYSNVYTIHLLRFVSVSFSRSNFLNAQKFFYYFYKR